MIPGEWLIFPSLNYFSHALGPFNYESMVVYALPASVTCCINPGGSDSDIVSKYFANKPHLAKTTGKSPTSPLGGAGFKNDGSLSNSR